MKPADFIKTLSNSDFNIFTGVPCSIFKPLLNYINDGNEVKNYICSSEGESLGLAAGFSLCRKIPVVYMQNDGYGNAINPLSSLQLMNKLPAILLISWRGEPGKKDAHQHAIMGQTILSLLDVFQIPYSILEDDPDQLKTSVEKANKYISQESKPFAFIVKKGYFEKYSTTKIEEQPQQTGDKRISYIEFLGNHQNFQNAIFLGATGFSGREVYQSIDHPGKFYMMGSMGCLASIGLGIALENPNRKIFVLDGDGGLLMKMGTLSTVGFYQPKNLIHICFDNNQYESTGGQQTASPGKNFTVIANACGYKSVNAIDNLEDFKTLVNNIDQFENPHFIHIKIPAGTVDGLNRPSASPEEMKQTIMDFLKK